MIKERQKIDAIDAEMARLFKERMEAVHEIALEKKASGAPVEDLQREKEMIERRCAAIENEHLRISLLPGSGDYI